MEDRTTKKFSTLAVLGAYSGRVLEDHGFASIHEVMDHFYPGIMTIGVAAMGKLAAIEIKRQVPAVEDFRDGEDWRAYAARGIETFGSTIELQGPLDPDPQTVKAAFDDFGRC
jgi:hypothetical protein